MNHTIITRPCREIRFEAKSLLSGKWGIAALTTLINILIVNAPSFLMGQFLDETLSSLLSIAYGIVIGGPLVFGYSLFILKLVRKEEAEISDLFEGFNHFGSSVLLNVLMGIFVFLWTLLLIIPGIIAALRYSQAFFILIDNPDMSPMEALNKSKQLMRGNVGKLFVLYLSFIGWGILAALTLGIGMLWLSPYFYAAIAVFYHELINKKDDENGNMLDINTENQND